MGLLDLGFVLRGFGGWRFLGKFELLTFLCFVMVWSASFVLVVGGWVVFGLRFVLF